MGQDSHGERLRTFITRPINATGKVPAIFFVGWELRQHGIRGYADTTRRFRILLRRLIEAIRLWTVRRTKPA